MRLTERQASMVATALEAGFADSAHSLCCADDAVDACEVIVGSRRAQSLRDFCYENLGCGQTIDSTVQLFLDKVASLIVVK